MIRVKLIVFLLVMCLFNINRAFSQRPNIAVAYSIPPWNKKVINYSPSDVFLQTTTKKFNDIKDVNVLFNLITESLNFHLFDTLIYESDLDFRMGMKFYNNNDSLTSFLWSPKKGGLVYYNRKFYTYNALVKSIFEKYNLIYQLN